jgi:hypothetical protein
LGCPEIGYFARKYYPDLNVSFPISWALKVLNYY